MAKKNTLSKSVIITLLALIPTSSLLARSHPANGHYTLRDVLGIVEARNPQILGSKENIEQAKFSRQIDESLLWPKVTASASQGKTKTGHLESDSYTGSITASMPIFDLTKIATYQIADIAVERSKHGHDSFLQIILRESANAFFAHLRNLKNLTFIETNLKRDEVLLDLARTQFEAGIATPIDVTRAESVLASRKRQYLQQQSAVRNSELNLKRLLTIPESGNMSLSDMTFDRDISDITPQFEDALPLTHILQIRPDYLEAEQALLSEEKGLDKAAWESVPTVSVSSQAGTFSRRPLDDNDRSKVGVTATISMPIFEGFRIVSNKRKARSKVRAQEHKLYDLRNRIEAEYYQALFDNKARYEQILLALKQIELAEQELELAENRFAQGVSDNQEVVDAQANLANAQAIWVDVIFQYNLSRIQLAYVKGNVLLALNE